MDIRYYRTVWDKKPVLRTIYDDMYRRIVEHCGPAPILELGGGSGNLKQRLPHCISSDIQFSPTLDLVADAQQLPFRDGSLGTVVMVDVLHHVEFPIRFLKEAARALMPGGRLVMIEPAITWGSTLAYRIYRHEPVVMSADPLIDGEPDPKRNPYASNQAIPTLIATTHRDRFHHLLPGLRITHVAWFSFVSYPLTGGFRPWSLISARVAARLLSLEKALEARAGRYLACRMLIVIEKG
jgi:SAM-dependent methyltransferase